MFYALLIAFGLAMDAFGASIALGSFKKNTFKQGLISSFMFGAFQAIMPIIGWIIGEAFKSFIIGIDHWLAFFLLSIIGYKMIREDLSNKQGLLKQNIINLKLIIFLAFATSIDALIVGMTIPFLGISIFLAVLIIGLVTFLMSMMGIYIGIKSYKFLKNKTGLLGGSILIIIGIKILIDHLFFISPTF